MLPFVDFFVDLIGLHINGRAAVVEHEELLADERVTIDLLEMLTRHGGQRPERWGQGGTSTRPISVAPSTSRLLSPASHKQVDGAPDEHEDAEGAGFISASPNTIALRPVAPTTSTHEAAPWTAGERPFKLVERRPRRGLPTLRGRVLSIG